MSDLSQYFSSKTIIGCIVCACIFFSLWALKDEWSKYVSEVVYTESSEDFSDINDTLRKYSQPVLEIGCGYVNYGASEDDYSLKDYIINAYDKDTKENLKNKVEIYGSVNTHKYGVYKIHYVVYSSHNIKAEKIGQVIVK